MIQIVPLEQLNHRHVAKMAAGVFPYARAYVHFSYWAAKHRNKPLIKLGMRLSSIAALLDHWVAVNEHGDILGTIGLYTYKKDAHEAVWMTWFCVSPSARGQGLGKKLIAHAAEQARAFGVPYFRLYTSTDENEAAAQIVYEKNGFKLIDQKKKLSWTKLYREKKL